MINTIFGEMAFDTGWKISIIIKLYGEEHGIIAKAKAYREEDGITAEQESAFADFSEKQDTLLKTAEGLLDDFSGGDGAVCFTPRTLLFERDGSYALLCDDIEDEDGGVAVCLSPKQEVLSQDEYL